MGKDRKTEIIKAVPSLMKETYHVWKKHNPALVGAAIAFYIIFSLAPLLEIIIFIAGNIFGQQAAEGNLVNEIKSFVGPKMAHIVQTIIQKAASGPQKTFAILFSIPLVLSGSTLLFFQLRTALNYIWGLEAKNRGGIKEFLSDYLSSFIMMLIIEFILFLLIIKKPVLVSLGDYVEEVIPVTNFVFNLIDFLLTFLLITISFALVYIILPETDIKWTDVAMGASVTSFLYTAVQFLIGLYVGQTNVGSAYGAIGSFTILFIWIYYSSMVFIYGAVFTKVYASKYGSFANKEKN